MKSRQQIGFNFKKNENWTYNSLLWQTFLETDVGNRTMEGFLIVILNYMSTSVPRSESKHLMRRSWWICVKKRSCRVPYFYFYSLFWPFLWLHNNCIRIWFEPRAQAGALATKPRIPCHFNLRLTQHDKNKVQWQHQRLAPFFVWKRKPCLFFYRDNCFFPERKYWYLPERKYLSLPERKYLSLPERKYVSLPERKYLSLPERKFVSLSERKYLSLPERKYLSFPERKIFFSSRVKNIFLAEIYWLPNSRLHVSKQRKMLDKDTSQRKKFFPKEIFSLSKIVKIWQYISCL